MKALPKVISAGAFEPCNVVMAKIEYEAPLSGRQRRAMIKRTKRFCAKNCGGSKRVVLQFQGTMLWVKQSSAWDTPFTKFHFLTLLNQKLGGPVLDQSPQGQVTNFPSLTAVSA